MGIEKKETSKYKEVGEGKNKYIKQQKGEHKQVPVPAFTKILLS